VYADDVNIHLGYWSYAASDHAMSEVSATLCTVLGYITSTPHGTLHGLSEHLRDFQDIIETLPVFVALQLQHEATPRNGEQVEQNRERLGKDPDVVLMTLKAIYADTLGMDVSSVTDGIHLGNGIDSLCAIKIILEARKQGIGMSVADLFQGATLRDIVRAVAGNE
jgi:acyl carrier protein